MNEHIDMREKQIQSLLEVNTMLARNQLLLEQELQECLDVLLDVVDQACSTRDCPHCEPYLDSMALSGYAHAIRYLARQGRVEIKQEYGRRVIARVKEQKKS